MASNSSSYWIIAVPNEGKKAAPTAEGTPKVQLAARRKKTLEKLQAKLQGNSASAGVKPFDVPGNLKVGTIDQLMLLSDELVKHDNVVGGIAKRIERTYQELYKNEAADNSSAEEKKREAKDVKVPELKVSAANLSPTDYIEKFEWDKQAYPLSRSIRQNVEAIVQEAKKAEEELKTQMSAFTEIRNQLTAIERKEQGSLLVKPLNQYIKKQHLIEGESLTTIFVVVAKSRQQEFESSYEVMEQQYDEEKKKKAGEEKKKSKVEGSVSKKPEEEDDERQLSPEEQQKREEAKKKAAEEKAEKKRQKEREKKRIKCNSIVPRSATNLADDNEFILYRVVIFKHAAEKVKNMLREKRYTVREFKFDTKSEKTQKEELEKMQKKKKALYNYLTVWCKANFSTIFAGWQHLKALRTFVEAVLRFGVPVDFAAAIILPVRGREKQLREALNQLYGHLVNANLTKNDDAGQAGDMLGEFYPYVWIPISLTE